MWEDIELLKEIIKMSLNKTDVLNKIGLKNNGGNYNTLTSFIKMNNIDISHFIHKKNIKKIEYKRYDDINDILIVNSTYKSTSSLKERLYREGIKFRKCELCEQDEYWKGKKISLILDHINGDRYDNRIENLQIVCPNCNATLITHCRGLNIKKEKHDDCLCGNKKNKNSKKCKYCELKKDKILENNILEKRKESRKVDRPSYNDLIKDINDLGYRGTGKKYGVSDNSIRKWIKVYNKYGLEF